MSSLPGHAKVCICKGCSALRLKESTPPDPEQGDIFAAVKNDSARPSFGVEGIPRKDTWVRDEWEAGQERKEEALTVHDQRRRGTLLWLRRQLATLYVLRANGAEGLAFQRDPYVTADDAERFLRANPDKDPGGAGAWKGAIFRGPDWQFTGKLVPSVIAENNGRGQRAWRYVGR